MPQNSQEQVGIMADPEFRKLPPEVQQRVLALARGEEPSAPPEPSKPGFTAPGGLGQELFGRPRGLEWLVPGLSVPLRAAKKGFQAVQGPINRVEEDITRLEERGVIPARGIQHYPEMFLRDTARVGEAMSDPSSALMGAAQLHPLGRLAVGTYMAGRGGGDLAFNRGRQEGESTWDYIQRIMFDLSGVAAGAAGIKSGGLRTPAQIREQALNRATFAVGGAGAPEVNTALRISVRDIIDTAERNKIKLDNVENVAKAVEKTNDKFNTQMALAEQPFANDQVATPSAASDLLKEAKEKTDAGRTAEAKYLTDLATEYSKPLTLREIGARVREFNKSYPALTPRSPVELEAENILRKSLRDTYLDYLEQKYPGSELREMRLRQEQIIKLRDQLGTYNKNTGKVQGGYVEKLRGQQASRAGGPTRDMAHIRGVASPRGIRAYLSIPEQLRRGPETIANIKARKAFKKLGPGRALPPLTPAQARAAGGAAGAAGGGPGSPPPPGTPPGGGGGGGGQVLPPRPPRRPPSAGGLSAHQPPTINQEFEPDIEQARRRASTALVKSGPTYTRPTARAGFGTGKGVENEPRTPQATQSLEKQLELAKRGGHHAWATRVMNKMEAAKMQGTDTAHFQAAMRELAPGRQFHELSPQAMSKVIQRAQQMKQMAQGGK